MRAAEIEALAAGFRACTLAPEAWTHRAHLVVGAWHVHRLGADAALSALRTGIRALNARHGTPETATRGYHETITAAYVRLIAELLEAGSERELEPFVGCLLASPLAERDALLAFWSRELLMSARARAEWTPPDRSPLAISALLRRGA